MNLVKSCDKKIHDILKYFSNWEESINKTIYCEKIDNKRFEKIMIFDFDKYHEYFNEILYSLYCIFYFIQQEDARLLKEFNYSFKDIENKFKIAKKEHDDLINDVKNISVSNSYDYINSYFKSLKENNSGKDKINKKIGILIEKNPQNLYSLKFEDFEQNIKRCIYKLNHFVKDNVLIPFNSIADEITKNNEK